MKKTHVDNRKKSNKISLLFTTMSGSRSKKSKQALAQEIELALWLKTIRKQSLHLTQAELAKRVNIPLGTIRYFEQTGRTSLQNFVRIASELHALELIMSLVRGEEPLTFHKIEKEKTIARLRDELAMQRKDATPEEIRRSNEIFPTSGKPARKWRMRGSSKWVEAQPTISAAP